MFGESEETLKMQWLEAINLDGKKNMIFRVKGLISGRLVLKYKQLCIQNTVSNKRKSCY